MPVGSPEGDYDNKMNLGEYVSTSPHPQTVGSQGKSDQNTHYSGNLDLPVMPCQWQFYNSILLLEHKILQHHRHVHRCSLDDTDRGRRLSIARHKDLSMEYNIIM